MKLKLGLMALFTAIATNASAYEVSKPFHIKYEMTHYYGGPKSAEAALWSMAFSICDELGKNGNNLMLNRESEVVVTNDNEKKFSSTAEATFICVQVGAGG